MLKDNFMDRRPEKPKKLGAPILVDFQLYPDNGYSARNNI